LACNFELVVYSLDPVDTLGDGGDRGALLSVGDGTAQRDDTVDRNDLYVLRGHREAIMANDALSNTLRDRSVGFAFPLISGSEVRVISIPLISLGVVRGSGLRGFHLHPFRSGGFRPVAGSCGHC